jgi:hypothetical protein
MLRLPLLLALLPALAACAPAPQPPAPGPQRIVLQSCDDGGSGGVLIDGVCL